MNKSELIGAISDKTGVTAKDVDAVLGTLTTVVTDAVSRDDKVAVPGFGTFSLGRSSAREGRNPATGETMQIPASQSLKFKQAAAIKQALNS